MTGGIERFTTPWDRFGGSRCNTDLMMVASRLSSWAWAFSSHGADAIEPLTPLSRSDVHPHASLDFARAATWPWPWLLALVHGSEDATVAPKTTRERFAWPKRLVMIRGAFRRQETLRRIRWPLQPRSRDRATAFGDVVTAGWRSRATLGLAPVLSRLGRWGRLATVLSLDAPADGFTRRPPLRARPPFTRPWPLFLERVCRAYSRPDVACRLLQLNTTCEQTNRDSWSSQGRRPRPPSFSRRGTPSPLRKRWHAASRAASGRPTPVMVPPTCVGLPNRDAGAVAPPRRRFWRPVCSEDRRARVEGPSWRTRLPGACDDLSCLRRVHTLCLRRRDDVPLLGDLRTSAVVGAATVAGGIPATTGRTDLGLRSDDAPRRAPPSRRPGCLRPSRHVKESSRRDCSLRPSRRLSRSRRPHFFPGWGQVLWMGIARSRCGHPRIREHREYRRLFNPLDSSRLGLTTQARQRARPARPSTRTDCLARTDAGRSA